MNYRTLIVTVFTALLGANIASCFAPQAAKENHKDSEIAQVRIGKKPTQLIVSKTEIFIQKDMPYANLRRQLLADKWQPLIDPECKENVGGLALICDRIPELKSCSGDGYCKMNFLHQNNRTNLAVITYGPFDDWNVLGQRSKLRVIGWSFQTN